MRLKILFPAFALVAIGATSAHAYIGPGAGIAVVGSLFTLIGAFLIAMTAIVAWPIRVLWRAFRVGNPYKTARAKRIVILGLDGLDPGLTERFMREGRLPHFSKLAEEGVFRPLATSHPGISPVAWSSFTTGVDPSRHSIYDFLTRDPCTYSPMLSSTEIRQAKKVVNIGKYMVPLDKPKVRLLQRSQAFWKLLGERFIFSIIQRVPITFPPVKFRGFLLSGMCVPDLKGTQGTFGFFSTATEDDGQAAFTGGEQTVLRRKGNVIRSRILGPENSMVKGAPSMTLPMTITIADDQQSARIEVDGSEAVELPVGRYSDWVRLSFKAAPGAKVHGIVRFYITSIDPEFSLYMTPIHIDPENPAMPISHPSVYSIYLAKKQGAFATLGLAEDTWALNERVIDEDAFLEQAMLICEEREQMFVDSLKMTRKGLVTCVFDTTDRIQHMFYRYLDPTHPANEGKDLERHKDAIAKVYEHMDGMLARIWDEVHREDTLFILMSDHGFTNFRRGVNLNSWLRDEGYLFLKGDATTSGEWFENIDWSRTRAFSLGLTGMFVNRKGRERSGIVEEGEEYRALVDEIATKLKALEDPQDGRRAIRDVFASMDFFDGPYRLDAPDLIIGYDGGFRNSWDCATGSVSTEVFTDNTKSWSGDHCVDPAIVPGVFFSTRPIATEQPSILDIAPSVLDIFGVDIPGYMQGHPLFPARPGATEVRGPLDADVLDQSGAAPGALVSGAGGGPDATNPDDAGDLAEAAG